MGTSSLMSEQSARTLGRERAALIAKVNALPGLPKTQAYRLIRKDDVEVHEPIGIVGRYGSAFIYKSDGRYMVCDACGLAMAFGMAKLRSARALARSIGPKANVYFERAANGDRLAASAVARLCRFYVWRDNRK